MCEAGKHKSRALAVGGKAVVGMRAPGGTSGLRICLTKQSQDEARAGAVSLPHPAEFIL